MAKITDTVLNDILRDVGVDISKKTTAHWIQDYYESKSIFGGKYEDGYICSCCGKKSWVKKYVCDGCDSIMTNVRDDNNG